MGAAERWLGKPQTRHKVFCFSVRLNVVLVVTSSPTDTLTFFSISLRTHGFDVDRGPDDPIYITYRHLSSTEWS